MSCLGKNLVTERVVVSSMCIQRFILNHNSWWILFKSLQVSLGRSLFHSILFWKPEPLWLPLYSQLHLLNLGICQPFIDFLSKYYIPQTISSQPVETVIEMRCLYSKLNFILIFSRSLRITPYALKTTLLNIYIYIYKFWKGKKNVSGDSY